jgi:Terminase RNaseH-like domain
MPKVSESKYLVMAGWNDVPHITGKAKTELRAATPPHLRKAREFGIPVLGSGAVFPVNEDDILIDPIPIPDAWPQIGGLDFGWDHPFAAVTLAWDRDKDCLYVTRDFRQSQLTPQLAAVALRAWDSWLPWAWPHDGLQHDKGSGEQLAEQYKAAGFDTLPERASFLDGSFGLEAGISEMLDRMQTGRWRVFNTCALWVEEYRLYHRKDGLIQKIRDDVISASRYAMMMRRYARTRPVRKSAVRKTGNWRVA